MAIRKTVLGRIPTLAGAWNANYVNPVTGHSGYPLKKRVTLYGSEFQSLIEDNTYAPATLNNAGTEITFDTTHWMVISNGSDAYVLNAQASSVLSEAQAAISSLNDDVSGKQDVISDLTTIRSGAAAGATAYQKPSSGIPSSDMASSVQASLALADSAIQSHQTLKTLNNESLVGTGNISITGIDVDNVLSSSSENPVQNKVITAALEGKQASLVFNTAYNASSNKVATMADIPSALPASDVSSWAKESTKPSYSYSEISNTPTIPTAVSDLTNDSGFTTNTGTVTGVTVGSGGTNYTPTDGVVTIPAYPTALPASDVSAWAKEANKPSYAYSEIGYTVNPVSNSSATVSLVGTIPLHIVTTSVDVTSVTLSANPAEGHSCHVIFANSGSSDLTVQVTHDATNRVCPGGTDPDPLTIPAGGYVEVDFLAANSKVYVRGV